ncbi:MAG: cysteine--tRNA ligase [Alphaproteobacteria bacterium]|nr:cysteine--tRNA ligase [Alphaproteobacteria bacterium]
MTHDVTASRPPVFHLFDTSEGKKTAFRPSDATRIGMYVCGPTVYDAIHIGNARPLVVFDVVYRLLGVLYGAAAVTYVRNITDIDDKIIAAAMRQGIATTQLTEKTIEQFHEDTAALGCLVPTFEPRATEYISSIIAMIERLIAAGNAYITADHVYFRAQSWSDYGKFARRSFDDQMFGARVGIADDKEHPADFVLWKSSSVGLDCDDDAKVPQASMPLWSSPWGEGRPGWHIECSAMSHELLGTDFDLHGGGQDLIFPHHQNEIAQSCCANTGSGFATHWMHNGYVLVDGEKMSKSVGNFVQVADVLGRHGLPVAHRGNLGRVLRLVLLQAHYRQPLNFASAKLATAEKTLKRLWAKVGIVPSSLHGTEGIARAEGASPRATADPMPSWASLDAAFLAALCDDLNTPAALARIHALAADDPAAATRCLAFLGLLPAIDLPSDGDVAIGGGIAQGATSASRSAAEAAESGCIKSRLAEPSFDESGCIKSGDRALQDALQLAAQRDAARRERRFADADALRDQIEVLGFRTEDSGSGQSKLTAID